LIKSNHTKGVSILAPFNNTIEYNVKSLLSQEYPKFEVVVINDGTDETLENINKV
jgi:glycosyltransferase involved in cell wall biosynthesis